MTTYVLKRDRAVQARRTSKPVQAAFRVHFGLFSGSKMTQHRTKDFDALDDAQAFAQSMNQVPGVKTLEMNERPNGIEALQGWPSVTETANRHAERHAEMRRAERFETAVKIGSNIKNAPTPGDLSHAYADLVGFLTSVRNESEREALRRAALESANS